MHCFSRVFRLSTNIIHKYVNDVNCDVLLICFTRFQPTQYRFEEVRSNFSSYFKNIFVQRTAALHLDSIIYFYFETYTCLSLPSGKFLKKLSKISKTRNFPCLVIFQTLNADGVFSDKHSIITLYLCVYMQVG